MRIAPAPFQGILNVKSPLGALADQLDDVMLRDRQRLMRRLQGANKITQPDTLQATAATLAEEIARARQATANRRAVCPTISYPPGLPVSQKSEALLAAIRDNQV
ncbi:ATP-dependent helicase HrpA, partial [Edwardsiella piscicida]